MSYNYKHSPVHVSEKIDDLCYAFDKYPSADNAKYLAEKHLNVIADIEYVNGKPSLNLVSRVTSPEHLGIDHLVEQLKSTLFAYADADTYTVMDERAEIRNILVR